MEYLAWGAGKNMYRFINEYYALYFYKNPIKAVVDSDPNKWGNKFLGYSVISPNDIKKYSFDRILLCSHYHDISKEIVHRLLVKKEKIITQEEVLEIIYHELVEEYSIFKKNILVIGDTQRYSQRENIYKGLFNVIGVLDYYKLEMVGEYKFDYILLMNLMNIPAINNKNMCKMEAEEAIIKQIEAYGIERNKIVSDGAFSILRGRDYPIISEGNENEDKTFLVYRYEGTGGLGALVYIVSCLVGYAKEKGYNLVVDGQSYKNQYLEDYEVGKVNAWEKFFEQPDKKFSLSDIQNSKNVIVRWGGKKGENALPNLDFLILKPELKYQVEKSKKFYLKGNKVLGVLYRGTDYANRRPYGHAIQPDLSEMLDMVEIKMAEWGGFEKIFLATEVEEAVAAFESRFPNKIMFYPQKRVPANYSEYLVTYKFNEENDAYKRGADYWAVLNILADCDSLIAGNVSGTMIVEMLNKNRYTNKFIFDLGLYGIDDRITVKT